MGTIIAKHFDFCYNLDGNRKICIVAQENKETGKAGRRLIAFPDSSNADGNLFQSQLNTYLKKLQKTGKKLEIENCDSDNICQVEIDFSKLFK